MKGQLNVDKNLSSSVGLLQIHVVWKRFAEVEPTDPAIEATLEATSTTRVAKKPVHPSPQTAGKSIYLTQKFINERVNSMPERLQAMIDGDDQMTGY